VGVKFTLLGRLNWARRASIARRHARRRGPVMVKSAGPLHEPAPRRGSVIRQSK
jgi:hypothetical protein